MPFITNRLGLTISQDVISPHRDEDGKLIEGNGLRPLILTRGFDYKVGDDGLPNPGFQKNVYHGVKHSEFDSFASSNPLFYVRTDLFARDGDWERLLRFFIGTREFARDIPPIHYVCDINFDFRNLDEPERNISLKHWKMMNDKKLSSDKKKSAIDFILTEKNILTKKPAITEEQIEQIEEIFKAGVKV